jgi:hypothetical protein
MGVHHGAEWLFTFVGMRSQAFVLFSGVTHTMPNSWVLSLLDSSSNHGAPFVMSSVDIQGFTPGSTSPSRKFPGLV